MRAAAKKNGMAPRSVTLYPSRKKIEIAPGVRVAQLPREHVPELAIIRWQAIGDGTYRPIVKVYEPRIRVTDAARILGLDYRTLLRLFRAGMIEGEQIAPNNIQVSLTSWFEHVEKVRNDPEFWSRKTNIQKYRDAL
jgi:hypothetical protein